MPGSYQIQNAAIAIEAAEAIAELPPEAFPAGIGRVPSECLKSRMIAEGIAEARWPGRFEVIAHCPLMIVDGAHNPDGVRAMLDSVRLYLGGQRLILVMGVFADKDYRQMLEMISAVSDTLIAFRPEQSRGLMRKYLPKQHPCILNIQKLLQVRRKLSERHYHCAERKM